jgi:hypothetical protein
MFSYSYGGSGVMVLVLSKLYIGPAVSYGILSANSEFTIDVTWHPTFWKQFVGVAYFLSMDYSAEVFV